MCSLNSVLGSTMCMHSLFYLSCEPIHFQLSVLQTQGSQRLEGTHCVVMQNFRVEVRLKKSVPKVILGPQPSFLWLTQGSEAQQALCHVCLLVFILAKSDERIHVSFSCKSHSGLSGPIINDQTTSTMFVLTPSSLGLYLHP